MFHPRGRPAHHMVCPRFPLSLSTTMKNTTKVAKGLLLGAAFILVANLLSCTAPTAYPVGTPNPLDAPGHSEPTVAELHAANVAEITGDPTRIHR